MDGNAMKKKRQQKNPSNFEAEKMAMIYSVFYLSLSGKIYDLPLCKAVTPSAIGCTVHTQMNIMKAYTLQQQHSLDWNEW